MSRRYLWLSVLTGRSGSPGEMMYPKYSIVIPAYNEAARLERTLARVLACVTERGWNSEILVVDDGSTDNTAQVVEKWMNIDPRLHLIQNAGNRGKGYSVRNGLLQAAGEIVMFTDADLSAPMEEAEHLFRAIEEGADVAIGSRWLERARQTIHQPWYRRFFGRCFNALTRLVMGLPYADTQCGFKAFRRPAAQIIFRLQRIERWGFDPEVLFIAQKLGCIIKEVPVSWGHDERSKMSYLRDGARMLEDMAIIRSNSLAGRYDKDIAALKDTSGMITPPVIRNREDANHPGSVEAHMPQ